MSIARRVREFAVIFGAFVITAAVLYWIQLPNGPKRTTMRPLGSVLEVKGCSSGKRSLQCTVRTSTHVWVTDVTDWPGNIIQVGDELSYRFDATNNAKEQWVCRNGLCRSYSMCWRWESCWKQMT